MKNLLRKNDYVRNKDRQDPIAVLKLSDKKLVKHMIYCTRTDSRIY